MTNHDSHFHTDHLSDDLKGRAIRGGAVTMAAQAGAVVLRTGSTMVLARLLMPEDFGLVAMVTAITGVVELFRDAGLSMATVQRPHITHEQVSVLFWVNVGLSMVLALVTALMAPAIAWFYGEPRLTAITLALSATFIFGGLSSQHQALLQRQMRFLALAVVQLGGMAAGIAVAIGVALLSRDYWALVAMSAASGLATMALVWSLCRWTPGPPRRGVGVRSMLVFGGNLTGFNVVNYLARNADDVMIGWWWGGGPLGIYSKAYGLFMLPLRQFNGPIARVAIPALSRCADDPAAFRRSYLRFVSLTSALTMPVAVFSALFPQQVIALFLGPQWGAAVEVFRGLALASLAQPLMNTTGWVFIARGRTDRMRNWGIVSSLAMLASFAIGLPFGITTLAYCYTACVLALTWPCLWYAFHATPLSMGSAVRAHGMPLALSLLSGLVALGGVLWLPRGPVSALALAAALHFPAYAALATWAGLFHGLVSSFPWLERFLPRHKAL